MGRALRETHRCSAQCSTPNSVEPKGDGFRKALNPSYSPAKRSRLARGHNRSSLFPHCIINSPCVEWTAPHRTRWPAPKPMSAKPMRSIFPKRTRFSRMKTIVASGTCRNQGLSACALPLAAISPACGAGLACALGVRGGIERGRRSSLIRRGIARENFVKIPGTLAGGGFQYHISVRRSVLMARRRIGLRACGGCNDIV
jgi:hypothetical protein